MQEQRIMAGWSFYRGVPDRFSTPERTVVDLPHDMQVGLPQSREANAASGFFPRLRGDL